MSLENRSTGVVRFMPGRPSAMLAGEIIIVSDAGETTQLGPGDAFVTPKGFTGTWEVRVAARKTFALYL